MISSLVQPGTFLCLAALLLSLRCWWKPGSRRSLAALLVVIVLLVGLCLPIVNRLLLGSLEWSYPPRTDYPDSIEAIVILGGYVQSPAAPGLAAELGDDSLQRCLRGEEIYRVGRTGLSLPIITCGGPTKGEGIAVGQAMRDFLATHGIPADDLIVEDRS